MCFLNFPLYLKGIIYKQDLPSVCVLEYSLTVLTSPVNQRSLTCSCLLSAESKGISQHT